MQRGCWYPLRVKLFTFGCVRTCLCIAFVFNVICENRHFSNKNMWTAMTLWNLALKKKCCNTPFPTRRDVFFSRVPEKSGTNVQFSHYTWAVRLPPRQRACLRSLSGVPFFFAPCGLWQLLVWLFMGYPHSVSTCSKKSRAVVIYVEDGVWQPSLPNTKPSQESQWTERQMRLVSSLSVLHKNTPSFHSNPNPG